jgi:hypothetical protein
MPPPCQAKGALHMTRAGKTRRVHDALSRDAFKNIRSGDGDGSLDSRQHRKLGWSIPRFLS